MAADPSPAPRVLVVEDDPAQQLMYRRLLPTLGFAPTAAADTAAADALLAREAFPCMLLDLNLGTADGLAWWDAVRDRHPALQVVVVTGVGTLERAQRAMRLEAVDFLSKPVRMTELKAALDRAWTRHRLGATPVDQLRLDGRALGATGFENRKRLDLEEVERDLIVEALRRCHDNRAEAARLLGISERKLYYRLSQFTLPE